MDGYLLINKPKGWTSFDVVNKIRHTVQSSGLYAGNKKRFPVGHTGTLDPLATGLLVILLGGYTKRAVELTKLDKTYEVSMRLGQISSTGDEEGQKQAVDSKQPTVTEIKTALESFVGKIEQVPPVYSAIKVDGQRAYKLARAGQKVKMQPKKVKIYRLKLTDCNYPIVEFTAEVSSGTYIRSLVEDIGTKLGTGAYMSDLNRTKVGHFDIKDALNTDQATAENIYKLIRTLD